MTRNLTLFYSRKYYRGGKEDEKTYILPSGTMLHLGGNNLLDTSRVHKKQRVPTSRHKFSKKSGMSFEEVFQFKYGPYISTMQRLANYIGKDKFIEMLKKASSEVAEQRVKNIIRNLSKNDFDAFINMMVFTPLFKNTLSMEIVEKTDPMFPPLISLLNMCYVYPGMSGD